MHVHASLLAIRRFAELKETETEPGFNGSTTGGIIYADCEGLSPLVKGFHHSQALEHALLTNAKSPPYFGGGLFGWAVGIRFTLDRDGADGMRT